jgi:hypothetical protein
VGDDFGAEAPPFGAEDAGAADAALEAGAAEGPAGPHLRLVHGIVNLGQLSLCYDPDRVLDDPATAKDETSPGPKRPTFLVSAAALGTVTPFVSFDRRATGALTLHEPPSLEPDAGADAATLPAENCLEETLTTALALPAPQGVDAGAGEPSRGLGTIFASGLALDAARVEARAQAARAAYLSQHAGDESGAQAEARRTAAELMSTLGPQLTPGNAVPVASPGHLRLALGQLTPDVPSSDKSGGVRVCVTAGTLVTPVDPAQELSPIAFREQRPLSDAYPAGVDYHFRVFSASELDSASADCATTSLKPLAELTLSRRKLTAEHIYGLVLLGALNPVTVCSPLDESAVVRAGCALPTEELTVQLQLLTD